MNSPTSPTVMENVFEVYRDKYLQSKSKILKVLGVPVKLDIPVSEIEKEGLKAVLISKVPMAYFMQSLLESYSSELLCSYLDIECYENSYFATDDERRKCAQKIYSTYLDPRSFLEINVGDAVKKDIVSRMKTPSQLITCFTPAKEHVLMLLEQSFTLFLKSEAYQLYCRLNDRLLKEVDADPSKAFSYSARKKAYDLLQTHVPPIVVEGSNDPVMERKRYIGTLIGEFVLVTNTVPSCPPHGK
jgi:Regulator of G protein signaling domain